MEPVEISLEELFVVLEEAKEESGNAVQSDKSKEKREG